MSQTIHTKPWKLPRRTLLSGAGISLALPLLEQMLPKARQANAAGKDPNRLLVLFKPNGTHAPAYLPTQTGTNYTLSPTLAALAPYMDQLVVASGLQNEVVTGTNLHIAGICGWLTGFSPIPGKNSISIDQLVANSWKGTTAFPSLQLGTDSSSAWYKTGEGNCDSNLPCKWGLTVSWSDANTPVPIEMDPKAAFDRLFTAISSAPASTAGTAPSPSSLGLASVLDAVRMQTVELQAKVGPSDRRRLDEYLTGVRALEARLAPSSGTPPTGATLTSCAAAVAPGTGLTFPERLRAMMDVVALAFQCDLTRVSTLMMAEAESGEEFRFLGLVTPNEGQAKGHHAVSHHGNDPVLLEPLKRIDAWYTEQVAYLVGKLKAIQEAEGTLLDNSLVLYGSEMGDGDSHSYQEMPVALLGGQRIGVPSGRHVRASAPLPLANLHVTLLQLLGIPASAFGNSSGTFNLTG